MVPITNTWGQHFEHMYFVMGRNPAWSRMKKKCTHVHDKEGTLADLEHYHCGAGAVHLYPKGIETAAGHQENPISFLYSKHCADKYFGASPTCKLDKSMLYFL